MGKLVYLKVLVLLAALAMIVSIIHNLSADKVAKSLSAIGVAPGTSDSPGLQPYTREVREGEERFNLCRTRVHAVVWPDGKKVEELKQGLKLTWRAFDPEPRELPYLGVEKWFSRHCQIVVKKASPAGRGNAAGPTAEFKTFLTLEFIDGTSDVITRADSGLFRLGKTDFVSDDLEQAAVELSGIAQFVSKGP